MIEVLPQSKQKNYKYLQSIGIEFKKQRRFYTKKKHTFKQLHNKTQTLGRYAKKLQILKQFEPNNNDIFPCNNNSEYRSLSNNSYNQKRKQKYHHNKIIANFKNSKVKTKKTNSSSQNILTTTNNNNFITSAYRRQFNITTYQKVDPSEKLSATKFYGQFNARNKIKFNRHQQQVIKILNSPNNGIIFNKKKGQNTSCKYIHKKNYSNDNSLPDNTHHQSPHFKSIQYSIRRRIKTMTLQDKQIKKKQLKLHSQSHQFRVAYCPSSIQLQNQLTFQLSQNKESSSLISNKYVKFLKQK